MTRFTIYTLVSITFCLGYGAFGPAPRAAAASSAALSGTTAHVSLSDDVMSEFVPDAYQPRPESPNKLPHADVARPASGCSDGAGSGSTASSGSVMCRPSSPVMLPSPAVVRWAARPAPPFVRSGALAEVFEPPRLVR